MRAASSRVLGLAAIAIFLLACTNIASLLRGADRRAAQTELSVRTALGASASRLSRQLLIEHLVLAAIGRGCGDRRGRRTAAAARRSHGSFPRIRFDRAALGRRVDAVPAGSDDHHRGHARLDRVAPRHAEPRRSARGLRTQSCVARDGPAAPGAGQRRSRRRRRAARWPPGCCCKAPRV